MNIYFVGMCISFAVYIIIGLYVSRRVKSVEDYYVAGRRAPLVLIAGSMIASYASTGLFMGDAATSYEGAFSSMVIFSTMQTGGYIVGAIFFGRYIRRSRALTVSEFFGKRFCSPAIKKLAAFTAIVTMIVYLLSVIQGIGTLMSSVTVLSYNTCLFISMIVFTMVTVIGGASGVLITDTLMAGLFTAALIVSSIVIANNSGGWFNALHTLASDSGTSQILSWAGQPGALYDSGTMNVMWGIVYGVVWGSVCMVSPWQSSRYLMAKDEHTVIRSSFISAPGIFLLEFLACMAAVIVRIKNPSIEDSSRVLIWAAMNDMPQLLGIILLTGVLAAGISSATTFLSLAGASFANDILCVRKDRAINTGRIIMIIISVIVFAIAVQNSPAIFWVMFFGGAIIAASWMPVAFASILSSRVTRAGAFAGMLAGFLGCFVVRLYTALNSITLPPYFDPALIGMVLNFIAMIAVSYFTQVTPEEKAARDELFIIPDSEKNAHEIRKTLAMSKWSFMIGVFVTIFLLVFWVIPYITAK
ncbi:MAG: sodium:solute symporter family protein [Synergistaceae bacterium]|nr:sodium:solute symporter family protein [Synergistaceae bacterium]MBQ9629944.1 sodium:solute symporter family protein [Synergistaceae bacterium]MBR0069346.1 sodium:solute symporter family protein [Synergistaceae bacterium]